MAEIETITRKWGNSLGITIPKEIVEAEHLEENQKIRVEIKKKPTFHRFFGILKTKKSAQELKDEMRSGWE